MDIDPNNRAYADFLAARDFLVAHRTDQVLAARDFRWPAMKQFNWALEHFDAMAQRNERPALWIVNEDGSQQKLSFQQMSERSSQVANFLRSHGVKRGDRILLVVGNELALWETMLGAFKLGAVVIPATGLLTAEDLRDRLERGRAGHVIVGSAHTAKFDSMKGDYTRICVGVPHLHWISFDESKEHPIIFTPAGTTQATDPLLLYFTSGTTSKPKLVLHTHQSYPVGHLSTMYWIGLQPGDVHLNISSPGGPNMRGARSSRRGTRAHASLFTMWRALMRQSFSPRSNVTA